MHYVSSIDVWQYALTGASQEAHPTFGVHSFMGPSLSEHDWFTAHVVALSS